MPPTAELRTSRPARRVLIVGASGNVGRQVARALETRGIEVHAPDRTVLDLRKPTTYPAAVAGCDAMFLLRPPAIADVAETLHPLIDAAIAAGHTQIVFLSVAGAARNPLVPHHATERHLRATTTAWTFLRPGFFAQNLGDAYRRDIREDDRLHVPCGRGRVAWVDVRDIATVAADVFANPAPHAGAGYTLTGAAVASFAEVAALLTLHLGRAITYQPASIVGYLRHLRKRRDLPWKQALVQTVLHTELRRADERRIDPTLARLLGHPPRTVADYIRDHVAVWARTGTSP